MKSFSGTLLVYAAVAGCVLMKPYGAAALFSPVIQNMHTKQITCIAADPDGRYMVSAGDDRVVNVWDIRTGMLLRSLSGHVEKISGIAVGPGGKYIVTGSVRPENLIRIWDAETGSVVRDIKGYEVGGRRGLAVDPDGRFLAAAVSGGFVVFDLRTGKEIVKLPENGYNGSVAFDGKGSRLIGANADALYVWETSTWKPGRRIDVKYANIVAADPRGRFIAYTYSWPKRSELGVLDMATGRLLYKIDKNRMEDGVLTVNDLRIDGSGRYLAAACEYKTIVFELSSGKMLREIFDDHVIVRTVDIVGGRYVAYSGDKFDNDPFYQIILCDINTGDQHATISGSAVAVYGAAFHPSGDYLVTAHDDAFVRIWDVRNGAMIKKLGGHAGRIFAVAVDPGGKYIASAGMDKTIRIWDFGSGAALSVLQSGTSVSAVLFGPGNLLVSGAGGGRFFKMGSNEYIKIWDYKKGTLIKTIRGEHSLEWHISSLRADPSNEYFVAAQWLGTIEVFDFSGKLINRFNAKYKWLSQEIVHSIALDPVTKCAAAVSPNMEGYTLYDVRSGASLREVQDADCRAHAVAIDAKGQYLAAGSTTGDVFIYNLKTHRPVRRLKGHSAGVATVEFSPDGRYLLSGGFDSSVRVWNPDSGEGLSFSGRGDDWILFNDRGFFDASRKGGVLVSMVESFTPYAIDQFAVHNNRPDIILAAVGTGNPEAIEHYNFQYRKRMRKSGFAVDERAVQLHVPEVAIAGQKADGKYLVLSFKMSDSKYRLKSYNIYVNDVPLFGAYGKGITGSTATVNERIELTRGKNKIEVSCLNEKGAESFRALTRAEYGISGDPFAKGGIAQGGDLYFIGFGISSYKNSELDLGFAHQDVLDLAAAFGKMQGKVFNKVHVTVFVNEQVTVEKIRGAKALLSGARADDTFVLFIAGHGVHDVDQEATYYYLTHDADEKNLRHTAANFELIEDLMQGIAPRNKLFLMDTCESGELDEAGLSRYASAEKGQRGMRARTMKKLARGVQVMEVKKRPRVYLRDENRFIYNDIFRRSGAIVFSSCRGSEVSFEHEALRNGFFTEALLAALSGKADMNGDGIIETGELRDFVMKEVPSICNRMGIGEGEIQHPTVDRDNIYQVFGFPPAGK